MPPQLLQFSLVVPGKSHNPTILNPDFLRQCGIVPEEWGWEVAETFTTPALSLIRYSNRVSITVQEDRLQVSDLSPPDPTMSKIPALATSYVEALPHVHYSAVGTNFQAVLEVEDPDTVVKDRFIKDGPWNSSAHGLSVVGLRLQYPLEPPDSRLLLSVDSGQVRKVDAPDTPLHALIVSGNFHRPCSTYPAVDEVTAHASQVNSDWAMFEAVFNDVLLAKVAT